GIEPAGIAGDDLADIAEIGGGAFFARAKEQAVSTGHADGRLAQRAERCDQALVYLAGQDHERDVAGFGVGDAQAGDELTLLAESLQRVGELHAAAMHDGYLMAIAYELCDGTDAAVEECGNFETCPAQFDNIFHSRPSASR